MSKTLFTIKLDYDKTIAQAKKLEDAADVLVNEKNRLNDFYNAVKAQWKSDSAKEYLKKVTLISNTLSDNAKSLRQSAQTIRNMANRTYQAEKRAIEIARNNSGGGIR